MLPMAPSATIAARGASRLRAWVKELAFFLRSFGLSDMYVHRFKAKRSASCSDTFSHAAACHLRHMLQHRRWQ
jgi:hypothetical protein